ncbi:hypothetical protein LAZ67_X003732 [Cordylochernes scorpioides]|uniref:Uncharacterized protein n=1 Tax=Cordylochernes scorpioides TaxID=51811 RepID=A0ABY6LUN3_9ARAC|nr:hypothetical protein LAZ67_X003732 [Cordylochernes scorpioides]
MLDKIQPNYVAFDNLPLINQTSGMLNINSKINVNTTIGFITRDIDFYSSDINLPYVLLSLHHIRLFKLDIDFQSFTITQFGRILIVNYHNPNNNNYTHHNVIPLFKSIIPPNENDFRNFNSVEFDEKLSPYEKSDLIKLIKENKEADFLSRYPIAHFVYGTLQQMPIATHPNHIFSLDTMGGLHNYGIQPQYIEHDTETHTPIEKARKLTNERTIKSHEHSKQLYDIKHPEPIFKEGDQREQMGKMFDQKKTTRADNFIHRKQKFPEENFDYDSENKPSEESNIQELEEATQQQQNNVVPYLRPSARNKYYCELSSDEEELSDDSRLDPTFDPTEHNLFALDEIPIPNSYEEAINSKNPEYWIEAMQRGNEFSTRTSSLGPCLST